MKFGFICADWPSQRPSAIAVATRVLALALRDGGHAVTIFCPGSSGEADGLTIVGWGRPGRGRVGEWMERLRVRRTIAAWHRQHRLDGLEVPDFQGWLPWPVAGLPVHVRLHHSATVLRAAQNLPIGRSMRWWEGRTIAAARRCLAACPEAVARTRDAFGFAPPAPLLLPCAVDLTTPGCSPTRPPGALPYLLFCGARRRLKGVDTFLAMAGGWSQEEVPLEFVLAGEAGDELGDPPPTGGPVTVLDRLDHEATLGWMAGAVALIAPGRVESQGLAVAEAMGRGCPVVLPDASPFNQFYAPDEVTFVSSMNPEAWRQAVRRLLADPTGRRGRAGRAQERVRELFGAAGIAERWVEAWTEEVA